MIASSVKESNLQTLPVPAPGQGKMAMPDLKRDFQNVLDKQTGEGKRSEQGVRRNSGHHERISGMKHGKRDIPSAKDEETLNELPEEMLTPQEAAEKIIEATAVYFGIPQQDIEAIMQKLGLSETDLLNPEKLSDFLLTIGQANGSEALLTDAELYEKYSGVMEFRQELLQNLQNDFETDPKDLEGAIKELQLQDEHLASEKNLTTKTDQEQLSDLQQAGETGIAQVNKNQASEKQDRTGDEEKQDAQPFAYEPELFQKAQQLNHESYVSAMDETLQTDTENIMRQIMDYMKVQVKPDMSELEMQLHPASLGNLQIHLSSRGGVVTAQFIAQSETVRAALETQMVRLQESFEQQGVKIEAIEVTVQTHMFERNLDEQSENRQEQQTTRSRGIRRLRRVQDTETEQEVMTHEEELAAAIMEADGGTIDYTV